MGTERVEQKHINGQPLPKVDLGMFMPNDRIKKFDLINQYFGTPGMELIDRARQGRSLFDPQIEAWSALADQHFFNEIKRTFNLADSTDPTEFYLTSMRSANTAVSSFNQAVFPHEGKTVDLLNEITAFDQSPSTALFLLSSPNVSKRLRFEVGRQLAMGFIAASIEARSRHNGFQKELARMQILFAEELFTGKIGEGVKTTTYAWHDNDTNHVVELTPNREPRPHQNAHLKRHIQHMRHVDGIGNILADLNAKDIGSAITKALRKAQKDKLNGGEGVIDIDVAVHDAIRAKMIVDGTTSIDDPKIDALIKKVIDTVNKGSQNKKLGEIESIERDDEKNNHNEIRFKRLQIKFTHVPIPIEIIFYDQVTALHEEFEVGNRQDNGHYSGYAHSLYELQRLGEILDLLYPDHIYYPEHNGDDLRKAIEIREEQIAEELRRRHRVQPLTREALLYETKLRQHPSV